MFEERLREVPQNLRNVAEVTEHGDEPTDRLFAVLRIADPDAFKSGEGCRIGAQTGGSLRRQVLGIGG